jgi:sterol desaturase/sphingolipid hydroxylase (fatty acid hydroxylase superfamily)
MAPAIYLFTGAPNTLEISGILAVTVFTGALGSVLQHSHVWLSFGRTLDHIICVPSLHQIHHSQAPQHWDRNYAVIFSFWDWIFGTLYMPDRQEKLVYGVYGMTRQPHGNVIAAWLLPLWEMVPFHARIMDAATRFLGPSARELAVRMNLVQLPPPRPGRVDQASRG